MLHQDNHLTLLKIIVADDNKDNAESLAEVLQLWGHETHVCSDSRSALELYRKTKPDVMLLDIGFPLRTDGLQVARDAVLLNLSKQAVLVAITGHDDDETKEQALEVGFDHYFVKPVNLQKLEALLMTLAGKSTDDEF